MGKTPKKPDLKLKVLHVTAAGRSIVEVAPQQNSVTIGNSRWKVDRHHLFPGRKEKWDVVCVEGQSEALAPWGNSPITPEEFDAVAHNNLLEQLHQLAKGGRSERVSWLQLGLSFLLVLCIIGVGVKLSGDIEDMGERLDRLDAYPPNYGDGTRVTPGQQQSQNNGPQNLGDLQDRQAGSG